MTRKPIFMGASMGLMMMGMLHLMLTGESKLGGIALAVFVLVHIAIVLLLVFAGIVAARFSPGLRARMEGLHRPDLSHVLTMLVSAVAIAGILHLFIHGGL